MARWASNVIMRYVSDAPLRAITNDCKKLLSGASLDSVLAELRDEVASGRAQLESIDKAVREQVTHDLLLSSRLSVVESATTPLTVAMNCTTGSWHKLVVSISEPAWLWRTACGWRPGLSPIERHSQLPNNINKHRLCRKCWPHCRPAEPLEVASGSSSDDSS